MRQIAQNYRSGELTLEDVPVPRCAPGGVVVRTLHSLVSTGTEMMKVSESKLSLVGMARARPDQVKKVAETLVQQGPAATYRKVTNRLDALTPLGYSLAGEVIESDVADLPVGTIVACAGNEYALHAEYNWIPKNMCAVVPDGLDTVTASFATVGSIALHGVRRSEVVLGESAVVIGLGLIGQLLVRLLVAAGARVVGVDLAPDRCELAVSGGAEVAGSPEAISKGALRDRVTHVTDGVGADHVFLAAATSSNEPTELAVELARQGGRITDIGKVKLDLPWNDVYSKELDVVFSRSYGPGRYDPVYERDGVDYPIDHVRWTLQRNMAAFLQLASDGRLDLDGVAPTVVPFAEAVETYEKLNAGELAALAVVFEYGAAGDVERVIHRLPVSAPSPLTSSMRLGVIGAGNYATTMLLPHFADDDRVTLSMVATATALSTATAAERFEFETITTDHRTVLDSDVDAVVIATRHDLHASMVCEALATGKAVFVEKPLAIDAAGLEAIRDVIEGTGNSRLMVGFNRRFSPLLGQMRAGWQRGGPEVVHYTVNAGPVSGDSWYRDTDRHGTRFVGEGGHFIDTLSWWLGADPVEVSAFALPDRPDDIEVVLRYPDGSLGRISYLTDGSPRYPKETVLATAGGRSARLDNFKTATTWTTGFLPRRRRSRSVDKGQGSQVAAFVSSVVEGGPMPIDVQSLMATTEATLGAHRSAQGGGSVSIGAGAP